MSTSTKQLITFFLLTILSINTITTTTSAQLTNTTTPHLNITAIAATNQSSVLQCWQLTHPFTTPTVSGITGGLVLPAATNITGQLSYTILPSRYDGGLHNAPALQYVAFMSGLIHITLPNVTVSPTTEAWLQGGKYGLILAVDTSDVSVYGHRTEYPGDADTVALTIPVAELPNHEVLYQGPCLWSEMVGL